MTDHAPFTDRTPGRGPVSIPASDRHLLRHALAAVPAVAASRASVPAGRTLVEAVDAELFATGVTGPIEAGHTLPDPVDCVKIARG